jgi:hypothetical protein
MSLKVRAMFMISLRADLLKPFYSLQIFIFDDFKLGSIDIFKLTLDFSLKICFFNDYE